MVAARQIECQITELIFRFQGRKSREKHNIYVYTAIRYVVSATTQCFSPFLLKSPG